MDLTDLATEYGQFYTPAFRIVVSGRDLMRDDLVAVSQVEADLVLGGTGNFSFTIVNSFHDDRHAFLTGTGDPLFGILTFGAQVDIYMGYGDVQASDPSTATIRGMITEVTTGFAEGGAPEVIVSGHDSGFPMTVGKNTGSWQQKTDSDVADQIATNSNLDSIVVSTQETRAQIEQNQESDFEFLQKLATRNSFQVYVRNKTLYFGPPDNRRDGILTLNWGESLLSFKPQMNVAAQVAAVEVRGWDVQNDQAIIGRADAGDEDMRTPNETSAGQYMLQFLSRPPTLILRQPVFTQAEADSRAKGALNELAQKFVTGEGECIGLPELLPDTNITLGNLGVPFSRTYYVEKTNHKVDGSGYRTRFSIKATTI
jgi:phage protein D